MVFRRNIVSGITDTTVSGQGMMFGTFLMKNIFIDFPTPILNCDFCMILSKNSMLFIGLICTIPLYLRATIKFATKLHEIFTQNEQKIYFKLGVGKSMKIFFIRNVLNIIPWPLTVVPGMPLTVFLEKNMKISCFFMLVDYCRDSYCKCINYTIGGSEQIWAWRERWLWRDLFSRPLGVGSSASSMLRSWWFVSSL